MQVKRFIDCTAESEPDAVNNDDIYEFMDHVEETLEGLFGMVLALSMQGGAHAQR